MPLSTTLFCESSPHGGRPANWARATWLLARQAVLLPRQPRAHDVSQTRVH